MSRAPPEKATECGLRLSPRVRDAIDQVSDLLAGLASATAWGAAATLLTGFLVLIGAAAADQRSRSYEAAILKTLGATRARIHGSRRVPRCNEVLEAPHDEAVSENVLPGAALHAPPLESKS